jgi:hypothetical protein
MLRDISAALRDGTLTEVIDSETEVTNARDDVRNGMRIALSLFEATQWIYGPQAFGLRLANWVAKKGNRRAKASFILIWLRLRTHSSDLPSSQEIALLADEAEKIRDQSRQLRTLARNDKRFEKVFCPKRFHKALKDKISFDRFLKEIEAARMS